MNTHPSLQNQGKQFPVIGKKREKIMISRIDRKRIFIFIAIAYGLVFGSYLVIYLGGEQFSSYRNAASPQADVMLAMFMFAPMIAHIATRLITREGWSNLFLRVDLRQGRWRYYLAAWFLPIAAIIVGGSIYYLLFPGKFDPKMTVVRELGIVGSDVESWKFFILWLGRAILSPLPVLSTALFLSFGEEFGWRAYLLPKLLPLGSRKAILLVSAIWGAWHWPAILTGFNYGTGYWGAPVVGPLLFVWVLIFPSAFYAWVTLRSGSVWPAAITHSVNNAASMLMVFFISGDPSPLVGPGDQGIIGSLGFALLALPIFIIPGALAPVNKPLPEKPAAAVNATVQSSTSNAS
jgi:membrane protease YdiL (CAAX protease family)